MGWPETGKPLSRDITLNLGDWTTLAKQCRRVREAVFVEEQEIPLELEYDGLDPDCEHVVATAGTLAVGTGRLLPDAHIGRVAVLRSHRGQGIGRLMMQALIDRARAIGHPAVALSAQHSAVDFYLNLGFTITGGAYLDAGIEHFPMQLPLV